MAYKVLHKVFLPTILTWSPNFTHSDPIFQPQPNILMFPEYAMLCPKIASDYSRLACLGSWDHPWANHWGPNYIMFWLARFESYAHSYSCTWNERKGKTQREKIQETFQKKKRGGFWVSKSRHQLQRLHFCTPMVSHCKILGHLLNCLPFPTRLWTFKRHGLCFSLLWPPHLT